MFPMIPGVRTVSLDASRFPQSVGRGRIDELTGRFNRLSIQHDSVNSPINYVTWLLETHFSQVKVAQDAGSVTILFGAKTENRPLPQPPCDFAKAFSFLQRYNVVLELPMDALKSDQRLVFFHFLKAIAPFVVELKCYETATSSGLKLTEKMQFEKLELLNLEGCLLNDAELNSLLCPVIKELEISRNTVLSAAGLLQFAARHPTLTSVHFKKCSFITASTLRSALIETHANLLLILHSAQRYLQQDVEDVALHRLRELTGQHVLATITENATILTPDPQAVKLHIPPSVRVHAHVVTTLSLANSACTDEELIALLQSENSLQKLVLDNTQITGEAFERLEPRFFVQAASFAACHKLTDKGIAAIAKTFPGLQFASFNSCRQVTESTLARFVSHLNNLTSLDVRNCERVGASVQEVAYKSHPFRKHVVVDCSQRQSEHGVQLIAHFAARSPTLRLVSCQDVASEDFHRLLSKCASKTLVKLSIEQFTINDATLLEPVKLYLPTLKKLKLIGPIGSSGIIQLLGMQSLTALSITSDETAVRANKEMPLIDNCLSLCCEQLEKLEKLSLHGFSDITNKGLQKLLDHSNRLRISIKNCPNITAATFPLFVHFKEEATPYQITIRKACQGDIYQVVETLDRQYDTLNTIIKESPTCNPEALEAYKTRISQLEKEKAIILHDIDCLKPKHTASSEKHHKAVVEFSAQYPHPPLLAELTTAEVARYQEASAGVQALSEIAALDSELLLSKRGKLDQLIHEIESLTLEYQQGQLAIQKAKQRISEIEEEKRTLDTKSMACIITAEHPDKIKPLIALLEASGRLHNPCIAKLLEQLKLIPGRQKRISCTLLFTPDEIEELSRLKLSL